MQISSAVNATFKWATLNDFSLKLKWKRFRYLKSYLVFCFRKRSGFTGQHIVLTKVSQTLVLDKCKYLIQKQPPEVFYKKGVLKNFAKFAGKHLYQKETQIQVFSFEFCKKFLRTSFLQVRTTASDA